MRQRGDDVNRYKASKQGDVLMLFYLFSASELAALFKRLGYAFATDTIPKSVQYYAVRTSLGSTLSRVVLAWVLARSDRAGSMVFFKEALTSDTSDIQQGTTSAGVHLGAMAGSVDLVQRVATGLEVADDVLCLDPELADDISGLEMRLRYRGHSIDLRVTRDALTIEGRDGQAAAISLRVAGRDTQLLAGTTRVFPLRRGST